MTSGVTLPTAASSTLVTRFFKEAAVGWEREGLDGHEGHVALVLADGRQSATTGGGGVILMRPTPEQIDRARADGWTVRPFVYGEGFRQPTPQDDPKTIYHDIIAPWSAVKTWQAVCECGWRGNRVDAWDVEHPAWRNGDREIPAHTDRSVPEMIEEQLYQNWAREHADQLDGLIRLRERMAERRQLERDIDAAALAALNAGASWADLGRAADMTRQGALNRWGWLRDEAPTTSATPFGDAEEARP